MAMARGTEREIVIDTLIRRQKTRSLLRVFLWVGVVEAAVMIGPRRGGKKPKVVNAPLRCIY
jgi:hypothetical protein